MKILTITALYPPAVGGAAIYFGDVMPKLRHYDDIEQLIILTERIPGQPQQRFHGKLQLLRYLPTRVSLPQRRWLIHAATYVLTQLWFVVRLPRLVRQHGVDIIHFHTCYRGRLFYAALQRSAVPLIADLRDKMIDPARLVCVADWLLCCGEGVQRFAVEGSFPVERTRLSPIPFKIPDIPSHEQVCEVRRRYGLDRGSYILFVGDITYNKGVYDLLEAFRHWRSRHPGVQLALAGVNREGDQFWDQLKQAPGATYLGHVPHGDALTLMCAAEIVALPSRSEGLPRVILEAVALGTKVICPPGIPEFELHLPQFVLPTVSSSSICDMLELVWHTDQGPNYPLSNHDVDRIVQDLANVYREAI